MTPPPDHDRAPGRSGTEQVPATAADLRDLATWLKQRLEEQFTRLDSDNSEVTKLMFGDLAGIRAELLHLQERLDRVPDTEALIAAVREDIARAAHIEARRARNRALVGLGLVLVIGGVVMALPGLREAVEVEIFGFQGAQEPD